MRFALFIIGFKGCLLSIIALSLDAATFLKIADTSTDIPGGTGTFRSLDVPVYHAGQLAFAGTGVSQAGIYLWDKGRLSLVADRNTPVPGTDQRFRDFRRPTVENGTISFVATTGIPAASRTGLYQWREGKLSIIADQDTSVPAGHGKFTFFHAPFARGSSLLFVGGGDGSPDPAKPEVGIYHHDGVELRKLVSSEDVVPGKTVKFLDFSREEAAFDFDGQTAAFLAGYGQFAGTVTGIVCTVTVDGQVREIAGSPGYSFDYVSSRPRLDLDAVIVNATDNSILNRAIMQSRNSTLTRVLTATNEVPGIGALLLYGNVNLSRRDQRLIFQGRGGDWEGLYWIENGQGVPIVRPDMLFENKTPLNSSTELFDGRGFDGRHLAFRVRYENASTSIFLADLGPAPGEVAIEKTKFTAEGFQLEVTQNAVLTYRVEFVDQLSANANWQFLQRVTNSPPTIQLTDSAVSSTQNRFYRAVPE